MKSFRKIWSSIEAIQALFFADEERALSCSDEILRSIRSAFGYVQPTISMVSPQYQKIANQAVIAFRKSWPLIKADSQLHPMLWVRLALHASGPPVAKKFTMRLARWRARSELGKGNIFLLVYENKKSGKWIVKRRTLGGVGEIFGYTIDQIIVQKNFGFKDGFNEYERKWQLREESYLTLSTSTSKKKSVKTVKQACGAAALHLLTAAVRREAKSGVLGLLSSKDDEGKAGCSVSRACLLETLKNSNPNLRGYSDLTLLRGLSSIVKFRLGRPAKVDLKTTSS